MINYSIIIPHKNIPGLLQRCLDSIPQRDDTQVIVVDDNSDPNVVDYDHFPGLERQDVKVVFTKEGKGAGYARNVGLDNAEGKWLIFMDSDDFFSENYNQILDGNIDCSADLVFYDYRTVMSDDITKEANRDTLYHKNIIDYLTGITPSDNKLRYYFPVLWGKIINRQFVQANQIRFSESRWSNDIFFSAQIGCFADNTIVNRDVLYVGTQRRGSLTSNFCGSFDEFYARLSEASKTDLLYAHNNVTQVENQSLPLVDYWYRRTDNKLIFLKYFFRLPLFSRYQHIMIKYVCNRVKSKLCW